MIIKYVSSLLLLILSPLSSNAQVHAFGNYEIKKQSKECLILVEQGKGLDTLCLKSSKDYFSRNEAIEVTPNKIIKIEFIIGSPGLNNLFYLIEEWNVKNKRFFLLSSTKIPVQDCRVKRLKLRLAKDGINWTYRSAFLKRKKGLILFSALKEMDEYNLPCSN